MSENKEHVSHKAAVQIQRDGFEAGREAVEKVVKHLTDRGFERQDVLPYIKEGIRRSID
jgi:hypothetical protein